MSDHKEAAKKTFQKIKKLHNDACKIWEKDSTQHADEMVKYIEELTVPGLIKLLSAHPNPMKAKRYAHRISFFIDNIQWFFGHEEKERMMRARQDILAKFK